MSADERAELARTYLAEAWQRSVEQLAPTLLMRECAELRRLLGQVLDVLAETQRDRDDLSEQLAGVAEDRTEDAATITALRGQLASLLLDANGGKRCPCGEGIEGDCPGAWHGCDWHDDGTEPEDYDPGPEVDDESGMSECCYDPRGES